MRARLPYFEVELLELSSGQPPSRATGVSQLDLQPAYTPHSTVVDPRALSPFIRHIQCLQQDAHPQILCDIAQDAHELGARAELETRAGDRKSVV